MAKPAKNDELVYLDRSKLERLRISAGLSLSEIKAQLASVKKVSAKNGMPRQRENVSHNTVDKLFRGEGVWPDVAKVVADFFEQEVLDLLHPGDPRYVPPVKVEGGLPWEWEIESFLVPGGYCASNGLRYFLCRMKHRLTTGRFGRGRFYLLSGLSAAERLRKRPQLLRHADVCALLGLHPQLAETVSTTHLMDEEGWWIVDRWIESKSLAEHLQSGPWPQAKLPFLMQQIAIGLAALHRANVVMRELSPDHILIGDSDGQPILTDFELAKLLDGAPTVTSSGVWQDDEYRAPEVESGNVSFASDLYSWARILIQAASGNLPSSGNDVDALSKLGLPKAVWGIARSCLQRAPEDRPQRIEVVQQAISRWK